MIDCASPIDMQALGILSRRLYKGARKQNTDQFQDWAMKQVKSLIPFDSGIWITGFIQDETMHMHSCHLHQQPMAMIENYTKFQHLDFLSHEARMYSGKTINPDHLVVREEFETSELYQKHCRPFGIERTISTTVKEPVSKLFHFISLYRNQADRPFNERQINNKELLTPLLIDAYNLNLFWHLSRNNDNDSRYISAIANPDGILQELEPGFIDQLLQEWPKWQGPKIDIIPDILHNRDYEQVYHGERTVIKLSWIDNIIHLQIRNKSAIDNLTPAEKAVTDQLMQGLSNKEIANNLNISPKTVSHHLQSIYKKTDVANRQQAIAQLKENI